MTLSGAAAFAALAARFCGEASVEAMLEIPFERLRMALDDKNATQLDCAVLLRQALRFESLRRDSQASVLTNLGAALLSLGRMEDAIGPLRSALALQPEDAATMVNIAIALFDGGDKVEAERYCREALRVDPEYEQARQFLGFMEGDARRLPGQDVAQPG